MDDRQFQFAEGLRASVSSFLNGADGSELNDTLRDLLLGKVVSPVKGLISDTELPSTEISGENKNLLDFCIDLFSVGGMSREATDLKDYVLAIWVNLPKYRVPTDRKKMCLVELLDDAIKQMEIELCASLATLAPASLFSDQTEDDFDGFWRPSRYLNESQVKSVNDIYGVIGCSTPIAIFNGRVPLKFHPEGEGFPNSYFYLDFHKDASLPDVYMLIRRVFGNVGLTELARYENYMGRFFTHDIRTQATEVLTRLGLPETWEHDPKWRQLSEMIVEPEIAEMLFLQFIPMREDYVLDAFLKKCSDLDHYKVLYPLVCHILGLDPEICRKCNLDITISPDDPPNIGLRRREFKFPTPGAVENEEQYFLTVGRELSERTLRDPCFWLDVVKYEQISEREGDDIPRYKTIGVWTPAISSGPEISQASILEWKPNLASGIDDFDAWLN
ncbi:hypothetical protein H072_11593 [Dactylellina haptotyla CBS 200.50]|uniref:Uncharacterized protein n=1 Tax=Dactylellina haptotyla (strain CBS 200.50) TaxID=1284197 RepID=S8B849_DACHA|nr:hypothetical protein H072_11593 [Dactylellina haptotyla CBS 200.50]